MDERWSITKPFHPQKWAAISGKRCKQKLLNQYPVAHFDSYHTSIPMIPLAQEKFKFMRKLLLKHFLSSCFKMEIQNRKTVKFGTSKLSWFTGDSWLLCNSSRLIASVSSIGLHRGAVFLRSKTTLRAENVRAVIWVVAWNSHFMSLHRYGLTMGTLLHHCNPKLNRQKQPCCHGCDD